MPKTGTLATPRYKAETLNLLYNNRARVPEHAQHFAHWAQASAQARAQAPCVLDLPYGQGPRATLDVFPGASSGAPVLVFIHGGYWRSLDKADHSFIAPRSGPGRLRGAAELRAVSVHYHSRHRTANGAGAGLGRTQHRAPWRRSAPHHRGRAFGGRASGGAAAGLSLAAIGRGPAGGPGQECGGYFRFV